MKILCGILSLCLLSLVGCRSREQELTNSAQPGPQVGSALGTVVGAVPGQVIGGTVAAMESVGEQLAAPYQHPDKKIIRKWETVTTSDGRTIQVAREYYVDDNGEIIGPVEEKKKS